MKKLSKILLIVTILALCLPACAVSANNLYTRSGDYIYFGYYPQSKVEDNEILNSLTAIQGTLPTEQDSQSWTTYGYYINSSNTTNYMWYKDVELNGERYRGVYFTSYRTYYTNASGCTNQDDNGYRTGNVYWFKYEPIKWRILDEVNGKAFLLCEMLIDSQEYYPHDTNRTIEGQTIYANNYEYSTIREWLNQTFYNTAFNTLQQEIIQITEVDNSVASSLDIRNEYACNNTYDKIFLPSAKEITTAEYGFNTDEHAVDEARAKKTTAYAQCQGAATVDAPFLGGGYWWLRSPSKHYNNYARYVPNDGYIGSNLYSNSDYFVFSTDYGVAPALWLEL